MHSAQSCIYRKASNKMLPLRNCNESLLKYILSVNILGIASVLLHEWLWSLWSYSLIPVDGDHDDGDGRPTLLTKWVVFLLPSWLHVP